MEHVLLIIAPKRQVSQSLHEVTMPEMHAYAGEISRAGKLRGGMPLYPEADGARVRVHNGRLELMDGPFAESKEVLTGFMLIDAANRAEAIAIAQRCPATRTGVVTVHQTTPDRAKSPPQFAPGTRYMLVFIQPPDFDGDPDGAKYDEMTKWTAELEREGKYLECAGLPDSPPPARIETIGAKQVTTDGPFAETKEVVGGFTVVIAANQKAAIELASHCPHAKWGQIEVRQVFDIPPPE